MAYIVNKTDGNVLVTVNDGVANTTSTDITLVGKNYRGYGEILNENFVRILENFANTTAPTHPIKGQIWYDSTNEQIKVYDGSAFVVVGPADPATEVEVAKLYVGLGAAAFETDAGLTDAIAIMHHEADSFVQSALHNPSNGTGASTDFIVYTDIGDNDSGWMDMGITSSGFEAAEFGITGPGDGYIFMSAPDGAGLKGDMVLCTSGNGTQNDIVFATGGFESGREQMRLTDTDHDGYNAGLNILQDVTATTGNFYVGPNAKRLTEDDYVFSGYAGLTNATGIFVDDVNDFVQFAIKNENSGSDASTDLIAYASDGDNNSGWIGLGITSENFSDPEFTITGPGTGYIFMSAPVTTTGTGSLIIGTDDTGSRNDIVFFTGGFDAGNERMRLVGADRVGVAAGVEIEISTESTSPSTGALRVQGGIGLQGNLNVGGNVNIVGNITLGGSGNTVETETLAVTNPVIFMGTGNPDNLLDLGFAGEYNIASTELYTGLIKDVTDGRWKLFSNISEPGSTADFTGATYDTLYLGNIIAVGNQASTSTSTGTVVVTGGVGVSGNVYVGGTVYGESTSAQYADLAEKYLTDQEYPVGTVVSVGGEAEVTACQMGDRAIGTVSEAPAFMMNRDLVNGTYIALKGRVPCKVTGDVRKGDRLVAGENGHARAATPEQYADVFAIALGSTVAGDTASQIVEALIL